MSDYYGTEHTKAFALGTPPALPENVEPTDMGGRLRYCRDTYAFTGAETNGDKIYVGGGELPKGARIVYSHVYSDDYGGTATLEYGFEPNEGADVVLAAALDGSGQILNYSALGAFPSDALPDTGRVYLKPSGAIVNAVNVVVAFFYVSD